MPEKIHEFLKKKKQDYKGSFKKFADHVYTEASKECSNDGVADQIHEGFDPLIAF